MILTGDCIEHMKELGDNSVDAIVTDPPYGLEFMGKDWDKGVPGIPFWKEMLRVLKPGGFLLSFGGTRTYHRMACGIEDAGFEIRDCIQWLYGSGFPKSLNIGKQIDKMQGNERKQTGEGSGKSYVHQNKVNVEQGFRPNDYYKDNDGKFEITKGTSEWEGWGTALKPACEPIVVARKPLSEKNVALNVLKWGTGGINIDACRIDTMENLVERKAGYNESNVYGDGQKEFKYFPNQQGRFPANIILDEEAGALLDQQSGNLTSGTMKKGMGGFGNGEKNCFGESGGAKDSKNYISSKGGASRFFYCAKASKSERNLGCEELDEKNGIRSNAPRENEDIKTPQRKNNHPTVKPIKLMEYLIRLVTKEGAVVLDPFLGSGTTAIACEKLGRKWIGIEKEPEYIKIAEARIRHFSQQKKL